MTSLNEQPFFSCSGADRLCVQARNVSTDVPIPIFWPKGQFPLSVQASNLRLRLYRGDLATDPQDNPCSVGQSTPLLQSWDGLTTTNSPYSNMESALITIPSGNAAIESAFQSGSTSVFMQLTDPTNAICMLGPYSVIKAFTSLTISRGAMAPLPSVTVSSSTTISSPSMSVTATESVSTISISSAIPSTVGSSPSPSANVSDSALSSSSIPLVTILASVFGVLLLAAIALWFFLFYRKRQQKGSTSPWVASEKGAVGGDSVRALNADGDSIVSVSDGLTDKASISNYSPALGALDVNSSASGYVMSQKDAEDISIAFRNELFNKDNIE